MSKRINYYYPSSSAGPVPLSVYQRIKRLEDRILELEGLSPEYFQATVSAGAFKRHLVSTESILINIKTWLTHKYLWKNVNLGLQFVI